MLTKKVQDEEVSCSILVFTSVIGFSGQDNRAVVERVGDRVDTRSELKVLRVVDHIVFEVELSERRLLGVLAAQISATKCELGVEWRLNDSALAHVAELVEACGHSSWLGVDIASGAGGDAYLRQGKRGHRGDKPSTEGAHGWLTRQAPLRSSTSVLEVSIATILHVRD